MNLDAEKWSLLDKIHDYRFLLRLLGFALVVDLMLAVATGSNLWTFRWAVISDRPGLLLMAVLAYGVVMTLGSAIVSWAATDVLLLVVLAFQSWLKLSLSRPEPDPLRYVSWSDADAWLAQQTDTARRTPVEKQMADLRQDRDRWFSTVSAGWAGSAMMVISFWVPNSCVFLLSQWRWWAPLLLLLVPALPCAYHLWAGVPGHGRIELPELAEALYRKKYQKGPVCAAPGR